MSFLETWFALSDRLLDSLEAKVWCYQTTTVRHGILSA